MEALQVHIFQRFPNFSSIELGATAAASACVYVDDSARYMTIQTYKQFIGHIMSVFGC